MKLDYWAGNSGQLMGEVVASGTVMVYVHPKKNVHGFLILTLPVPEKVAYVALWL